MQQAFSLAPVPEAAPGFRPLQPTQPTSNPGSQATDANAQYAAYMSQQQQQQHPQQPQHPHPQQRPSVAHRPSSTPQMETLASESAAARLPPMAIHAPTNRAADLASMQQPHSTSRTTSSESVPQAQHRSSLPSREQAPPILRNSSGQSLADITMIDGPAQTPPPPRAISASDALTEAEGQAVSDLLSLLGENSYAYDSHVQLIGLLHKGFLAHTYPPADAPNSAARDPRTYGLLNELRQSREAMDSRFAVGEALWLDWLADETLLARNTEARIAVTELFQKAVGDEPASVKLWQAYGDWIENNYRACNDLDGGDSASWTVEDKEMCRDLFTRDMLISVLQEGAMATRWRIDAGHLVWNRWMQLLLETLYAQPNQADVETVRSAFFERLQLPHATSRQTAQELFWPFINKFYPQEWEIIMDQINEMAEPARRQMALRDEHELKVQRAAESADPEALFNAFSAYIAYERKHKNRGVFTTELTCGVYERALLALPTYVEWWLDYTDLIVSTAVSGAAPTQPLTLLERATRHCPWSGDLWARRILRSDVEGKPHIEIEQTKHRATNSGLLDVGGMEEVLKVLQQWCSYLRRHAFSPTASEDDLDVADVGITMALENIEEAGRKVYGSDFQGDPLYRLESIQMKFFAQARRLNDAREIWRRLVPRHAHEADFWNKYYTWEIYIWGYERLQEKHRVETAENGPHLATAVVQQALSQNINHLDWPERVVDMYLSHFQQHESGEKLQAALIQAREFAKVLANRRAKEAEAAAVQAAEAAAERGQQDLAAAAEAQATDVGAVSTGGEKRKAEDDTLLPNGEAMSKKAKTGEYPAAAAGPNEPSSSATAQIKRDREHNTITLRNLPADVDELEIKKFFRDVGQPASINILQDKASGTANATVEFEAHEDVLAAKTRNGREIRPGSEVRIQSGSQNTLYVANYPPQYDEQDIRKLFDSYGEIISVRFPSLKFNNRRRFCYVQFLTEETARAAEGAMDNKMLDGQHKLLARISNPDVKKQRSGAQAEGRELFVKNLERDASDQQVRDFFEQYGRVVSMNLLKLVNGKKTGTAFIVFAAADEATKALAADGKPFRDRILHVEISAPKAEGRAAPLDRARKTDVIVKPSVADASLEVAAAEGRRGSDVSMASASAEQQEEAFRTARERKIAILGLPDTVHDARIRAVMERYGPVVKIQLRRQEAGAIVEFRTVQDAFNVRQGVDVSSLGPEARTGDVADLLGKKKSAGGGGGGGAGGLGMRPAAVARPGQGRGGRRGGLGFKRGGGFGGGARSGEEKQEGNTSQGSGGARSNADFRAMFEAGRSSGAKPAADPDGA